MKPIYILEVVSHVLFGVVAIICYFNVWKDLLNEKSITKRTQFWSLSGAISLTFSLMSAGVYYVTFYLNVIKPIIGNSQYPWAHYVFMETKEHLFLFLLFLSLVITITTFFLRDDLASSSRLRKIVARLAGLLVVLGTFITLSGIITSGAIR